MNEEPEKVEFFHSESSFGSQSNASESRYIDFSNELIAEAENVFSTLKKEVQPNQALNNQERIQYALRRAQILHKDSIPQQMNYLNKIAAPENAQQAMANSYRRVGKLLQDYERLGKGDLPYKDFYNSYGKEYGVKDGSFSRKKEHLEIGFDQDAVIKPEYIQIAYSGQRHKLRGSTPRVFMGAPSNNDKESTALKEEVYQLKKTLEETRRKYELERTTERLAFQKRLKIYLNSSSRAEDENSLKSELAEQSGQLTNLLSENKRLQEVIIQRERAIESIKAENSSLKQQIVVLRKTDGSTQDYQEPHNKSYNSETNEISAEKRNEKRIKNLLQENQLLKNQLKTERQRLYRLQSDLTQEQKRQLERNRKALERKQQQLEQLYAKYDQQRIQLLQLTHNSQSASKAAESLKKQNELFKSKLEKLQKTNNEVPPPITIPIEAQRPMEVSRKTVNKVQIFDYEGEGIEGYGYYENLNKQFRVRFKRSCFRDKQLLYKANGIEVGVISNFQVPNKISILIHITNYSENMISNLKGKIINANENKIQGQAFQQESLPSNEQIKVPVSLIITQYPIGPLILILECELNEKKEQVRMLLPAHIFKTMSAQERADSLKNPNTIKLNPQRKICKEINDIRGYLKLPKRQGPIKINLYNQHTHTLLSADISQVKDGLELSYEHKQGNKKITEYFVKTLVFLLSK